MAARKTTSEPAVGEPVGDGGEPTAGAAGAGAEASGLGRGAGDAAETARLTARAEGLSVREDESPWTASELEAVRRELTDEVERLEAELDVAAAEILELVRNPGEGAGDDQADAGAQTAERQQELSLAQNSNDVMMQSLRALERIEDGSYGVCESCGLPIGKLRLQAFPRATLCVSCKQRQERH